jgi:Ca2+-binding RTX toxin-like protein
VIAANPNPAPGIPGSTPTPTPTPTPSPTPPEPEPTSPTGPNLQGTASADTIKGGSLGDSLSGGEGNDTIYGGDGNDVLSGGNGSDLFIFSSASVKAGGVDRITDFDPAADWIDLGPEFAALTNGPLRADEFRLGERAADWNDRIIYNKAAGELFYDADGNGAGAQVKFAEFTPNTSLAHLSFFVL